MGLIATGSEGDSPRRRWLTDMTTGGRPRPRRQRASTRSEMSEMLTEVTIPFDLIEVLADGTLQVREATRDPAGR